jgi:hypothetical protein
VSSSRVAPTSTAKVGDSSRITCDSAAFSELRALLSDTEILVQSQRVAQGYIVKLEHHRRPYRNLAQSLTFNMGKKTAMSAEIGPDTVYQVRRSAI